MLYFSLNWLWMCGESVKCLDLPATQPCIWNDFLPTLLKKITTGYFPWDTTRRKLPRLAHGRCPRWFWAFWNHLRFHRNCRCFEGCKRQIHVEICGGFSGNARWLEDVCVFFKGIILRCECVPTRSHSSDKWIILPWGPQNQKNMWRHPGGDDASWVSHHLP